MARSPTPSLRAQRERQREAFRREVLAAAREVIAADGPDGLSMRKLAQRLGCAPMSLYSYFRDKHDLLTALAHQGYAALARRLAAEAKDPPLVALRMTFLVYARHGLECPDDYRAVFMTPETQPSRGEKGPDDIYRENPAFAVGLDRVRACVEAGVLAGDPHAIATMLWTSVHGAVAAMITFPDFPFGDREAYLERTVDWALAALQAKDIAPFARRGP